MDCLLGRLCRVEVPREGVGSEGVEADAITDQISATDAQLVSAGVLCRDIAKI